MTTTPIVPQGWFPDPHNASQLRWWDGQAWTEHVHAVAPAAPQPSAAAAKPKKASRGGIAKLTDEEYDAGVRERIDKVLAALREGDIESAGGLEFHLQAFVEGRRGRKALPAARALLEAEKSKLDVKLGALLFTVAGEGMLGRAGRGASLLPMSSVGKEPIRIYEDRVVQAGSTRRIDEFTQAQIYLDGQKVITTRPSLTMMALASPLPGTALIPGLARPKVEKHDQRVAEFHVAGPDWTMAVVVSPDQVGIYRQAASRINAIADRFASQKMAESTAAGKPVATDIVSQIERIVQLQSTGAITAEQAEALKTQVIAGG